MNTSIRLFSKIFFILLLSFQFTSATANTGTVVKIEGTVAVNDSELYEGDTVKQGDTIKTGSDGFVTIVMEDETVLNFDPGTSFKFSEYSYNEEKPAESKSHFSLLKGTFRYISGLLAKSNPDNIKVTAGTATIGIRGTAFSMSFNGSTFSVSLVNGKIQVTSGSLTVELAPGSKLEGTLKAIENGTAQPEIMTDTEKTNLNYVIDILKPYAEQAGITLGYDTSTDLIDATVVGGGGGGGDTGCAASTTTPCP